MKQYTNEIQTAKLIMLGFEKPKSISSIKVTGNIITTADDLIGEPPSVMGGKITANYSIGELIDMLPEFSCIYDLTNMHTMKRCWYVGHVSTLNVSADELIDALYDMIVKLKEE